MWAEQGGLELSKGLIFILSGPPAYAQPYRFAILGDVAEVW